MANPSSAQADENALLDRAGSALRAFGIRTRRRTMQQGRRPLELRYGDQTITYAVECKRHVTSANIGVIANQLSGGHHFPPLLVTDYVSAPLADRLRELNVQFIDTAGNAFLHAPPLLVWITGRKPEQPPTEARLARTFQPGGLKLIFALLSAPELANASYRQLADAANVALGTVGWVMRDLKEDKYLLELDGSGRKLVNRHTLLTQWTEAYARQLRPRTLIGRYRSLAPDWQQQKALPVPGVLWGGESAAAKLTAYLKPAITTLYVENDPARLSELIKTLRLVKDSEGTVELRDLFWRFNEGATTTTVPPLLIYADLLATADDRNIETARIIYDDYLARLVEPA